MKNITDSGGFVSRYGRENSSTLTRRGFLRLAAGGLAGVGLVGVSGCGASASGDLTVASWNTAADALKACVSAFNRERPDVSVRVQYITTTYEQLLPRLQAGAGAPDVFSVAQQDFQNLLDTFPGQFVDLTERISGREDEFVEAAWSPAVRDGRVYGVPWDIGPVGMYYRRDFFEEVGIEPDSLTTYDAYIEAGKEIAAKLDGVTMVGLDLSGQGTNPSDYTILLNQQGGQFLTDDGRIDFTNEKSSKAVELVGRFKEEGTAINAVSYDDRLRNISNGGVATSFGAVWDTGSLRTSVAGQSGKWGITKLPAFEEGGSRDASLAGSVLVISSQSDKQGAAFDFIEQALLTDVGQNEQWANGLFPSWKPYWETPRFNEEDDYFSLSIGETFAGIAAGSAPLDYGPNFLDFRKPLLDAYGSALNGQSSFEEAMRRAELRAADASGIEIAND